MKKKIIYILFFTALTFFYGNVRAQDSSRVELTIEWQNPVWDHNFPDPTVIMTPDSTFYAYGTNGGFDSKSAHIQIAKSKDGVHWNWLGDAIPDKPKWASRSPFFWAPDVIYDKTNKRYVLYYAAKSNVDTLGMGIGMAVSSTPKGPFHNIDTPLICGKKFEVLDPMAFEDPRTGKHYMYWGSDFKPIMVQQLSSNWLSFTKGSKAKVALYPDIDHDYDKLIEGAWVIYHKGYYFLFYSGDNCCGIQAHYAVMVARSKHPEGPFMRYSKTHDTTSSVILQANDHWIAPGHNCAVKDQYGNWWMYYHAIPDSSFRKGNYSRVLLRDLIIFKNGWPVVNNGSPSWKKQETILSKMKVSG